jgi:hypothetical protein
MAKCQVYTRQIHPSMQWACKLVECLRKTRGGKFVPAQTVQWPAMTIAPGDSQVFLVKYLQKLRRLTILDECS